VYLQLETVPHIHSPGLLTRRVYLWDIGLTHLPVSGGRGGGGGGRGGGGGGGGGGGCDRQTRGEVTHVIATTQLELEPNGSYKLLPKSL